MKIKKYSNGLQMVYQGFDTPLSYCGVVVGSGSGNELKSEWGLAHLVEHMLFKGTKKYSYLAILDKIEGVGGDINAYTSKEDTCVYVSILNEYFGRAVDVLSDVCLNFSFKEEDLDLEKGVVEDEILSYLDSPSESIADDFDEMIFPDSVFGRNILGSVDSVRALTLDDLNNYCDRNYTLDNFVFTYAGGLTFSEVDSFVQQYFSGSGKCVREESKPLLVSPFYVEKEMETHQAHCTIGCYSVDAFNDNRLYYIFLNSILGGYSFNSLLNLKLREENGLTYNIDSSFSAYNDIGLFSVYFGTEYSKLDQCLGLIKDLFASLVANPLSEDVFKQRKLQFLGQVALHYESISSIMLANGKSLSVYGSIDSYDDMCRKIKELNYDVFVSVIRDLLDYSKYSTLIYK